MEHRQITSQRGDVHYWTNHNPYAKGTLVFTHGVTANHIMFDKQVAYFAKDYNLITWDVPLHGLSRPYADFSYVNCAKELCAILDEEGIRKVVLVGMSMGGFPAQMFAALYPERVAGFVALDTTPFGLTYYSKSDIWWLNRVATMANWFPERMLRRSMAKAVSKTKYAYNTMLAMLAPLTKAEIIEQMDIAYRGFVKENQDITLSCPVLILLGQYDTIGKVRAYCEAWANETGYPLVIIKEAAHFSNGDNPTQVNAEIQAFIDRLT